MFLGWGKFYVNDISQLAALGVLWGSECPLGWGMGGSVVIPGLRREI
jgi:hypothetical protein